MEDKAAVSRTVSKLEASGLVYFEDNGEKRRYRSKIRLTEKGEETAEKMVELIESAVKNGGEGLTEEEREIFYRSLGIIADNLQKICENKGETK